MGIELVAGSVVPQRTAAAPDGDLIARAPSGAAKPHSSPWDILPLREVYRGPFVVGTAPDHPAIRARAPVDPRTTTTNLNAVAENSLKQKPLPRLLHARRNIAVFTEADRRPGRFRRCGQGSPGSARICDPSPGK